jgi:hypothetical protein
MPNRMAWCAQKIQTAIAEVVDRFEASDLKRGGIEVKFVDRPSFPLLGPKWRGFVLGVAWREGCLDAGPDEDIRARGEQAGLAHMVPVGMAGVLKSAAVHVGLIKTAEPGSILVESLSCIEVRSLTSRQEY